MQSRSRIVLALALATSVSGVSPLLPVQAQNRAASPPILQWAQQKWGATTRGMRGGALRDRRFPAMGVLPSTGEAFRSSPFFQIKRDASVSRPAHLELTEYLPPVGHQGAQNSCVGWASAYYVYSYAIAQKLKLSPEQRASGRFHFSPSFIYNLGNPGRDIGMRISLGPALLRDRGCSSLQEMPFDDKDFTTRPSSTALQRAARYKAPATGFLFRGVPNFGSAPDIEKLKVFLHETRLPFIMAIPIFEDFPMGKVNSDYVYRLSFTPAPDKLGGLHCITVIGYDDEKKAIRIVNSWGTGWGDKGFLWLDEDFVRRYAVEGWAILPGGPGGRGVGAGGKITRQVTLEMPADKKVSKPKR